MTRSVRRADDGVALLFAIIFVAIVATIAGGVVTLASTNLRSTSVYTSESGLSAAADGAVQVAANTVRRTLYNASVGQHCFPNAAGSLLSGSDTMNLPSFATESGRQYSATVVCSHSGGSSSPVLINTSNRPGMAILTTGSRAAQGEPGISIKALNAVPFMVHGVIYSNSTIDMVSGHLLDDNGVYAKGACSGSASITPTPICSYTGSTPSGADPGYTASVNTVPAYVGSVTYGAADTPLAIGANPPNACKNTIVTFNPGYYDDAVGLSSLMTSSGCAGSTFWFKPGAYYFDFHNGDGVALASGNHVWSVNTGSLVAGTPSTASHKPVLNPSIPGSCVNPISEDNSATNRGVQFIFGGDSQFVVDAAAAEICGTYSSSSPPIAVYGVSGTANETQTNQPTLQMASGTGDSGSFTNLNGMRTAGDGSVATWNNTSNGNQTGSSTVTGFVPSANPPVAGAIVDQARMSVVHGNTAGSTQDALKVSVTLPDSSTIALSVPSYNDAAMHTDVVDFSSNATFLKYAHNNGLSNPLSIQYSAQVKHKGVESVDGLTLALKYRNPAFRSESLATIQGSTNCLTVAYTGTGNSSCAALSTTQAPANHFYIQGTAYAPSAVMDVSLNQATSQVFKFGVVARSLQIKVTGSSTFDQPVIEIPDDSPGSVVSTNIILSAYACPGTSPCGASGTPWLRARIAIVDPDPGAVLSGLRAITIQSWAIPLHSGG
jgi:hypothetical protein